MRGGLIFLAGAVLGAVAVLGWFGFQALDRGIGSTYRCDELGQQADERDLLHVLAQAALVGKPAAEIEALLRGIGRFGFDKGTEAIVTSPGPTGGAVSFSLVAGKMSEVKISGIDGRCASPVKEGQ